MNTLEKFRKIKTIDAPTIKTNKSTAGKVPAADIMAKIKAIETIDKPSVNLSPTQTIKEETTQERTSPTLFNNIPRSKKVAIENNLRKYVGESKDVEYLKNQNEAEKIFDKYDINANDFMPADFIKWAKEHDFDVDFSINGGGISYSPKKEGGFLGIGGKKIQTEQDEKEAELLYELARANANRASEKFIKEDKVAGNIASAVSGTVDSLTFGFADNLFDAVAKSKAEKAGLPEEYQQKPSQAMNTASQEYKFANLAGNVVGGLMSVKGLYGLASSGLSKIPMFTKLSPLVQKTITSAVTFGTSSAVRSTGDQIWNEEEWNHQEQIKKAYYAEKGKDYKVKPYSVGRNIANISLDTITNAAAGALGAVAGEKVSSFVLNTLKSVGLNPSAIAGLTAVSGDVTYSLTNTSIKESSNAIRAVANGEEYDPNWEAIISDLIISGLLSAAEGIYRQRTQASSSSSPKKEYKFEYFSDEDMSNPEALKKKFRTLSKQYHPDVGGDTTIMAKINAEYEFAKQRTSMNVFNNLKKDVENKTANENSESVKNAVMLINENALESEANTSVNTSRTQTAKKNNTHITANMSETERYDILKSKAIMDIPAAVNIPQDVLERISQDVAIGNISSWEDINKYFGSKKRTLIQKIASEFGVFKDYSNADVNIEFQFSKNDFRESYSKQGHNYKSFAKMFSVFDKVVENAIGIEVHNRNSEGYKPDATLKNSYVLVSAFSDGDLIYPVKLEVKEFSDKKNSLYVAITLNGIKKTEVWKQGTTENGVAQNSRSVNISIQDIFRNVNVLDTSFLKYIPNQFLTDKQIEAKNNALELERRKYSNEPVNNSFSLSPQTDTSVETVNGNISEEVRLNEQWLSELETLQYERQEKSAEYDAIISSKFASLSDETPGSPRYEETTRQIAELLQIKSDVLQNVDAKIEALQAQIEKNTSFSPQTDTSVKSDSAESPYSIAPERATLKEYMSMEDFSNSESPVWRNVAYEDEATKQSITKQTHSEMVSSGNVVVIPNETIEQVGESYPDLRGIKKKDRVELLKDSVNRLKNNLRQFLSGFRNQTFEFDVNGNVLEAKLYTRGINEVTEKLTEQKANMLYSSSEIFRNAKYLYSTPDYDGNSNIYRWNYFYTPVQIGETIVGVRIAVRDMIEGENHLPESQIYHWGIKKDASLDGVQPVVYDSSHGISSDASENIINSTKENVNNNFSLSPQTDTSVETVNGNISEEVRLNEQWLSELETLQYERQKKSAEYDALISSKFASLSDETPGSPRYEETTRQIAELLQIKSDVLQNIDTKIEALQAQIEKNTSFSPQTDTSFENDIPTPDSLRYNPSKKATQLQLTDETYKQNCKQLVQMDSVTSLVGTELDGHLPLKEKISNLFKRWGNVIHTEKFGDVALTNSSIRSEARHGTTREKVISYAAIPSVLKNGVVIDVYKKNRGEVERVVVAAPITISNKPYFMGVMIQRDVNTNRLYLHDVVIKKEASEYQAQHLNTTGAVDTENLFITDVLEKAISAGYIIHNSSENVNGNISEEVRLNEQWLSELGKKEPVSTEPYRMVSTEPARANTSLKDRISDTGDLFYRKLVDSGKAVSDIGKLVKDKFLYMYYNSARNAHNTAAYMMSGNATDINGNITGKSLNDIFSPIKKMGKEYYADFQSYLFHKHNVSRMSYRNQAEIDAAIEDVHDYRERHPEISTYTDSELYEMAYDETSYLQEIAAEYVERLNHANSLKARQNKSVFGEDENGEYVTAEKSEQIANDYLEKYPEFSALAEEVYGYIDNLMKYRIDSGLITEMDFDYLKSVYPYYVPTYRVTEHKKTLRAKNRVDTSKAIGKATGGTTTLMDLEQALSHLTEKVVREGSKNRFGMRLFQYANTTPVKKYITDISESKADFNPSSFIDERPGIDEFTMSNIFSVYNNGKKWDIEVNDSLYEAVSALAPQGNGSNLAARLAAGVNSTYKKLITGYNPLFWIRNGTKDIQDAGINSKDLSEFVKAYPLAYKEILGSGEYWQRYQALGGLHNSLYNFETRMINADTSTAKKVLEKIEGASQFIEQIPRLAEFMATINKNGGLENASPDVLNEAMYNSAEVTTNFGRSGAWSKMINTYFVPFWNPAIQGFDKVVRNVSETKGYGAWFKLITKCAILGYAPYVINSLLYDDDEEWEAIREEDKANNYLFKYGEGKWIKIPRGRFFSALDYTVDEIVDTFKNEEFNAKDVVAHVSNQIAPANPLTNNFFAPIIETKLRDDENPGETWYGTDIESQSMQSLPVAERYDAKTDEISKVLGKALDLSPKKINYLLNQYGGVLADVILPFLTPAAENNPISSNFTLNTLASNRYTDEYYDEKKEAEYAANSTNATPQDELMSRYWTQQNSLLKKINKEIRRIEADTELSGKEKKEMLEAQYKLRNALYKKALDTKDSFKEASEEYYNSSPVISDEDKRLDFAYTMTSESLIPEISNDTSVKSIYDKFSSAGFAEHIVTNYTKAIAGLKPLEGKKSVSLEQKWQAVIDVGYPELTTLDAMKVLITGDEDSKANQAFKLDLCYENNVPLDAYVQLKSKMSEYDANKNGSYSVKEYQKAIDSLFKTYYGTTQSSKTTTLTLKQKAVLWQIVTGSTSTANNPYSSSGASAVANAFESRSGESSSSKNYPGQIKFPSSNIRFPGQ